MLNSIGNDIVDLTDPYTWNKTNDTRFIKRVFTLEEQNLINLAPNPNTILWQIWSAKEASFKAIKRIFPKTVFAHKFFSLNTNTLQYNSDRQLIAGPMNYHNVSLDLSWSIHEDYIHCIATITNDQKTKTSIGLVIDKIEHLLTDSFSWGTDEKKSIFNQHSLATRVLAKKFLQKIGLNEIEIIRSQKKQKFGPPCLYFKSKELKNYIISMSHDHNYAAFTFLKIAMVNA